MKLWPYCGILKCLRAKFIHWFPNLCGLLQIWMLEPQLVPCIGTDI